MGNNDTAINLLLCQFKKHKFLSNLQENTKFPKIISLKYQIWLYEMLKIASLREKSQKNLKIKKIPL